MLRRKGLDRAWLIAPVLAAAVFLTGCSSGPIPDNGGFSACAPAATGKLVVIGVYDLHNTGSSPVKITAINVAAIHGLRMTSAWLTPILRDPRNGDWEEIGMGFPYPPSFTKLAREEWRLRQPLIGATIKPRQDLNLVFGVARTGTQPGRLNGLLITYTSGWMISYTVTDSGALELAARC